ncbi:MAG: valine--tRNA ligase, partial [Candidatus Thiodiazotropha sp.]
ANASDDDRALAEKHRHFLDFLARTESIEILAPEEHGPESATALVGEMKVLIPLAGLIDKAAEEKRLQKEVGRLEGEIVLIEKKLNNPNFVDKAPQAVVQKEQDKLADRQSAVASLQAQLEKIQAL